jgi:hypothetical protein
MSEDRVRKRTLGSKKYKVTEEDVIIHTIKIKIYAFYKMLLGYLYLG